MAKTNEFVSKTGKQVALNLSNNQTQLRPGRYQYIDADLYADICEATGATEGKTDALFKVVMEAGLKAIGLNVEDYSLERATIKEVRNKSINPDWLVQHTHKLRTQ